MLRRLLFVVILLLLSQASLAQRVLTVPDLTALTARGTSGLEVRHLLPLPDGGSLLLGAFEVSYEGRVFRDVLRLKSDGMPDTRWQVLANAAIEGASVLPAGVLVHGRFDTVNGQRAPGIAYLAFDGAQRLRFDVADGATRSVPGNFDRATGFVYMTSTLSSGFAVNRVSASTGLVDGTWRLALPNRLGELPGAPLVDQGGGLWLTWVAEGCVCLTSKMARFSIALPARELVANIASGFAQAPLLDGDFAYVGARRYRITDGSMDAAWSTVADVYAIDRGYAYVKTSTAPLLPGPNIFELRRALLAGNGVFDAWSLALPEARFPVWGPLMAQAPVDKSDAVGVIAFDRTLNASGTQATQGAYGLVSRSDVATVEVTVIEYYVPLLERFFITGRIDEQYLLDDYPRNFVRTGMSFAAKSSRYRDQIPQAVCRFYSSPVLGGSNTHFYGSGSDCAALNTLATVRYEGFDFAVQASRIDHNKEFVCPDEAPFAVIRLYNNRASSNDSSHRYVTSVELANRMAKTGWLNEGVVFCVAGATDANY